MILSSLPDDGGSRGPGAGGPSDRARLIASGAILALFLAVVLVLSAAGATGRSYVAPTIVRRIEAPHFAYPVWQAAGARGRILVLLDRRLNASGSLGPMAKEDPPLQEDNYVYLAARNNIVRTIYHVIPLGAWQEVEAALKDSPYVSASGRGYRTATDDGVPLFIARLEDLPLFDEPVLVNINIPSWSDAEVTLIDRMRETGMLKADLVTLTDPSTPRAAPGTR